MEAAPDYLGTGAIEIEQYETEIMDLVRRSSTFINRVPKPRANGAAHRYFEQTAIATGAFTDVRAIAPVVTSPTRAPRTAMLKAIVAQSNINIFDKWVTQNQGQFAEVINKDITDVINACVVTSANAVWSGTDTSLSTPTTLQYVGLLRQITNTVTVTPGASVIDAVATAVATMAANVTFNIKPTAIYINPLLGDAIAREAKAARITVDKTDVGAGVKVSTITTQVGDLPLIPEPYIPATTDTSYGFPAPPAGYKNYFAVIVTEPLIEMPWQGPENGSSLPTLFQLGLQSGLQGQFVAVLFNCILAKGPSYAHAIACIQLPA